MDDRNAGGDGTRDSLGGAATAATVPYSDDEAAMGHHRRAWQGVRGVIAGGFAMQFQTVFDRLIWPCSAHGLHDTQRIASGDRSIDELALRIGRQAGKNPQISAARSKPGLGIDGFDAGPNLVEQIGGTI
jgi:hypothetical protein